MYRYFIIAHILLVLATGTVAQTTVNFEDIRYKEPQFSHQFTFLGSSEYRFIDTSFSSLKWYRTLNATFDDDFGSMPLLNMGDARNQLTLPEIASDLGNYFTLGPYEGYFTNTQNVPFYQVRSPYTEAQYFSALNRGQVFSILHTQNINKRWNFVLRYRRLNSLGTYQNAQNIQSRFLLSSRYVSKNQNYRIAGYVLSEKMDAQENGGLENDSVFEQNIDVPRESILVNLRGGSPDLRVIRNREFFFQQEYKFLESRVSKDTTKADTLQSKLPGSGGNYLSLLHEVKYQRRSITYTSNAEDFYDNYFFQERGYTDSVASHLIDTRLMLAGNLGDSSNLNMQGGLRAFQYNYVNNFLNQYSGNLGLVANISGRIKDLVDVNGNLEYVFAGPLTNNLSIAAKGRINLFHRLFLEGGYHYQVKSPEFFAQRYVSNNFIWLNNFQDIATGIIDVKLGWQGGYLAWKQFNANNWVYFNGNQLPDQATQAIKYTQIEARRNFDFWGFVHLDNRAVFQQSLAGEEFLPLPNWVTRNALYFDFALFKKALSCMVGTELNYFSSFNSPSYSTGTGRFFLAREKEIGNYPYLDLFAQFKIKRAKVFLKYQHVNEGLQGYRYYSAPAYPLPDRVFRIGISWRFFN